MVKGKVVNPFICNKPSIHSSSENNVCKTVSTQEYSKAHDVSSANNYNHSQSMIDRQQSIDSYDTLCLTGMRHILMKRNIFPHTKNLKLKQEGHDGPISLT